MTCLFSETDVMVDTHTRTVCKLDGHSFILSMAVGAGICLFATMPKPHQDLTQTPVCGYQGGGWQDGLKLTTQHEVLVFTIH